MTSPTGRRMFRGAAVLLALAAASPTRESAAAVQDQRDKNSVELIVRGCLKGRDLTATDVSSNDRVPTHIGATFRVSAKRDVNDAIKKQNGHAVQVTGLVKKTALAEPGLKIGGFVIGGSPVSRDPTRDPARNPSVRVIPIEVTAIEMVAESCSVRDQESGIRPQAPGISPDP